MTNSEAEPREPLLINTYRMGSDRRRIVRWWRILSRQKQPTTNRTGQALSN